MSTEVISCFWLGFLSTHAIAIARSLSKEQLPGTLLRPARAILASRKVSYRSISATMRPVECVYGFVGVSLIPAPRGTIATKAATQPERWRARLLANAHRANHRSAVLQTGFLITPRRSSTMISKDP